MKILISDLKLYLNSTLVLKIKIDSELNCRI